MYVAIRGLGGAIGSTLVFGAALRRLNSSLAGGALGSILELPPWRSIPLIELNDVEFIGWDVNSASLRARAEDAGVLNHDEIETVAKAGGVPTCRPAPARLKELDHGMVADQALLLPARDAVSHYRQEIAALRRSGKPVVAVNLSSAEPDNEELKAVTDPEHLQQLVDTDSSLVNSGVAFALACIEERIPYVDYTSDVTLECVAIQSLAQSRQIPIAGKDGNTGQTALKLVLAEMFIQRNLQIAGWYSANVLGNLDGQMLTAAGRGASKRSDKLQSLRDVVPYEFSHAVSITYERSRGDFKESWDSISCNGWLNRRITLRVDWCSSDSILAVPQVLDIARLMQASQLAKAVGLQNQLACFFKNPIGVRRTSLIGDYKELYQHYANLFA